MKYILVSSPSTFQIQTGPSYKQELSEKEEFGTLENDHNETIDGASEHIEQDESQTEPEFLFDGMPLSIYSQIQNDSNKSLN